MENAFRYNRDFEVGNKVLVVLGTTVLIKGRVVHKDNLK